GHMARRRQLGITTHLTKPVKQAELWKAILTALGEGAAERAPAAAAETAPGPAPGTPLPPLRILLAEDNPFNQQLARGLLGKRGHWLVGVGNGAEAVAAAEREAFDLVLMDVQMPEMDGLQATRQLRQRERDTGRHLPIVA